MEAAERPPGAADVPRPAPARNGRCDRAPAQRGVELGELRRVEQGVAHAGREGRAPVPAGGGCRRRPRRRPPCPPRPPPGRRPATVRPEPGCPCRRWHRGSSRVPTAGLRRSAPPGRRRTRRRTSTPCGMKPPTTAAAMIATRPIRHRRDMPWRLRVRDKARHKNPAAGDRWPAEDSAHAGKNVAASVRASGAAASPLPHVALPGASPGRSAHLGGPTGVERCRADRDPLEGGGSPAVPHRVPTPRIRPRTARPTPESPMISAIAINSSV